MFKNRIVLIIIILLLIALSVWLFLKWLDRDVVAVKVAPVTLNHIKATISASGMVKAPIYDLGSKMGGKLDEIYIKEGDRVRKGQLLAKFDSYEQAKNDFDRLNSLYKQGFATKQQFDAAKTALESAQILAPENGIVGKINFDKGETVVPGSSAITVVNDGNDWIEAQVDEVDLAAIKVGQKAAITTDVYPEKEFPAVITWIAPLAELRQVAGRIKMDEESLVFPIKLKVIVPHKELKANMTVNADIVTDQKTFALVIPREALVNKEEKSLVFIINNDRALEREIKIGIRSFTSLEATAGLSLGEEVAISNLNSLKNKGRVKIGK